MESALVGAAIKLVGDNLKSLPTEEIGRIWNFKKEQEKLKKSLLMLQDFLDDAETKQVTEKSVQRWLMNLEDVAFKADYVFDQINYRRLRKKVQSMRPMASRMKQKVSSITTRLSFRYRMTRKIKKIKNELKSFNKEAKALGLVERVASSHASGSGTDTLAYRETNSFSEDPIFVGRDDEVAKMVELVISVGPGKKRTKINTLAQRKTW